MRLAGNVYAQEAYECRNGSLWHSRRDGGRIVRVIRKQHDADACRVQCQLLGSEAPPVWRNLLDLYRKAWERDGGLKGKIVFPADAVYVEHGPRKGQSMTEAERW